MSEDTDTPADERCDDCGRLDPINCPCEPEEDVEGSIIERLDELVSYLENANDGRPIWTPPGEPDQRNAALQAHYDDAARIRAVLEGRWNGR